MKLLFFLCAISFISVSKVHAVTDFGGGSTTISVATGVCNPTKTTGLTVHYLSAGQQDNSGDQGLAKQADGSYTYNMFVGYRVSVCPSASYSNGVSDPTLTYSVSGVALFGACTPLPSASSNSMTFNQTLTAGQSTPPKQQLSSYPGLKAGNEYCGVLASKACAYYPKEDCANFTPHFFKVSVPEITCKADPDCPPKQTCVANKCKTPTNDGNTCPDGTTIPTTGVCPGGVCPGGLAIDVVTKSCACPDGKPRGVDGKCGKVVGSCPVPRNPDGTCPPATGSGEPCVGVVVAPYSEGPATPPVDSWTAALPSGLGQSRLRYTYLRTEAIANDSDGKVVPVSPADQRSATVNTADLVDSDLHTVKGSAKVLYTEERSVSIVTKPAGPPGAGTYICTAGSVTVSQPSPCNPGDGSVYIPGGPGTPAEYGWQDQPSTTYTVNRTIAPASLVAFQCKRRFYTLKREVTNAPVLENDNEDPENLRYTYRYSVSISGEAHKRADQPLRLNGSVIAQVYDAATGRLYKSDVNGNPFVAPSPTQAFWLDNPSKDLSFAVTVPPFKAGDQFCARVIVSTNATNAEVAVDGTPKGGAEDRYETPRPECPKIYNKPYFKVYGGDVIVGVGAGGSNCSAADARLLSQARPNPLYTNKAIPGYRGSSGDLAIMVINSINGFYSDSIYAKNGATNGTYLTFANTVNPPWGGQFGTASKPCPIDSFASFSSAPCVATITSGTRTSSLRDTCTCPTGGSGCRQVYKGTGDITLKGDGGTARTSIYVDGNVYITDNTAMGFSPTEPAHKYFSIVTNGNIIIDPKVSYLSGYFFAKGYISTCGDPRSQGDYDQLFAACNSKLTINGRVVAKTIKLLRTNGSLRSALPGEASTSTNIAEVFVHNAQPELGPQSIEGIDTITALPPIF